MAKKRKLEASQPNTLHDFFGKGANKKPKTTLNTGPNRKIGVKQELNANATRVKNSSVKSLNDTSSGPGIQDVIEILDSDDENYGPSTSTDARSAATENDDLRVKEELRTEDCSPETITDSVGEVLNNSTSLNKLHVELEEVFELSNNEPEEIALLVSNSSPLDPAQSTYNGNEDIQVIIEEDDWGMGDDEAQLVETFDVDEPDDIEMLDEPVEVSRNAVADTRYCPLCSEDWSDLDEEERTAHVNKCLDRMPSNDSSCNLSSKSKLLRPGPKTLQKEGPSSTSSLEVTSGGSCLASETPKCLNAFSFLMSRNKENEAWKEATLAENSKILPKVKAKGGKNGKKVKNEYEENEDNAKSVGGRRPAPFYKVMQGMPIAVDAFRYGKIPGVTAYFLTHAHSDHYTNLSSSWKHGPVYCSQTTANLIIHLLGVEEKWVKPLPFDQPFVIPDTGGAEVTLISANHCPGSCLFMFSGTQTVNAGDSTFHSPFVGSDRIFRYLHCGDFRACPEHVLHPAVCGPPGSPRKKLDLIYLDTTYLDPRYCFPPQRMVINACAELASRIVKNGGDNKLVQSSNSISKKNSVDTWVQKDIKPKAEGDAQSEAKAPSVLVVVGTYSIGKERILKAIARILNTRIYCDSRKRRLFKCQDEEDPGLQELLSEDNDPLKCGVHVLPLGMITSDKLVEYLDRWKGRWDKIVGFRPTGWTYTQAVGADTVNLQNIINREQKRDYTWANLKPTRQSTSRVMLYGVPYSEHSSFFELTCFALSVPYVRMIATVNVGSARSRNKMNGWFEKWEAEKKRREREGFDKNGVVGFRHREYW